MRKGLLYIFILISLITIGCGSSSPTNIDRGSNYKYRPGYPEVRFSAIGIVDINNNNSFIKLSGDIVFKSLVFKNIDDTLRANILIEYNVISEDDDEYVVSTQPRSLQITPKRDNRSVERDLFSFEEDVKVKPGSYRIQLLVTDRNSLKQTTTTAFASIPDPNDPVPHMTNVQILGKNQKDADIRNSFYTLNTYDITNNVDSLKFVFQVTNNKSEDPLIIRSRLIRFQSDTTIARAMYLNNYPQGSIMSRGINYGNQEVIQSTRRVINQPGSVLIGYKFKNLDRGNYRFEVESEPVGDEELVLYKAREFGIKSESYPLLAKAHELAAPLRYLMSDKEHQALMSISDPDSMKIAIDKFWLGNIKDPKVAKNVIALFYERVEEANKLFSNFKEGWKTDQGMVYILFGPPFFIDQSLTTMAWYYSYNRGDLRNTIAFFSPRARTKEFPFDNYVINRASYYSQIYFQQRDLWLSGNILRDNL